MDLTPVESEGASTWGKIRDVAWGIGKTLGSELSIGAIFDRDYRCDDEIDEVCATLSKHLSFIHIHRRKEVENYFLVPEVLDRALGRAILERSKRIGEVACLPEPTSIMLERITDSMKNETQGQYLAKWTGYYKSSRKDPATLTTEAISWFEQQWKDLRTRLMIVPGKQTLRLLRDAIQGEFGVNLTDQRIVDSFHLEEVPEDIKGLVDKLDQYRKNSMGTSEDSRIPDEPTE